MTHILEIAEDARREMLQCQRAAIRSGARYYARSPRTRLDSLRRMGVLVDPILPALKFQLRSPLEARHQGSWRYSQARYIAVMQCIGGELILAQQSLELEAAE